eukprot:TRINITY_DN4929_c0_g1_i2.p1 TRINITY_DN4929_c0_g1~~TRINITY_DN4929_c0_g1_i2.p1  ORF type:complete len:213 (-),score=30.93 TRINITY_DN4929_c0_g1_i2:463-1101(-)
MSKYISSSYSPVVFEDSISDIAHAVEQLTDLDRTIPIPKTDGSFIYNRTLYSKLLSSVALLQGQTINDRPLILAETEITSGLIGTIVEKHELQWGLVYNKDDRKRYGKNSKEVSLSNIKKFSSDLILQNITLEVESLQEYLEFVEAELDFLNTLQEMLVPETIKTPKKGPSSIVSKPIEKSELERFKGIAEKMRLLQQSSEKKGEGNPDDLW